MTVQINSTEARVLGCLVEKELTTPEYYPLSLNALTNACNQKSNRDPVTSLSDAEVQTALDSLVKNHLVSSKSSAGSRVPKYAHRLSNPITHNLDFSREERAVLCELLVRGPQTAGELRTRAARMCEFADLNQVDATIRGLVNRGDGPFVVELPRQPGRRETRFAHLFCGAPNIPSDDSDEPESELKSAAGQDRLHALEREVAELRSDLARMREQLLALLHPGEGDA